MAPVEIEREALRILAGTPCPRCGDRGIEHMGGATDEMRLCACGAGRRFAWTREPARA